MVLSDEFIESVITPETESTDVSETMDVTRAFYGMEAKAIEEVDEMEKQEGE